MHVYQAQKCCVRAAGAAYTPRSRCSASRDISPNRGAPQRPDWTVLSSSVSSHRYQPANIPARPNTLHASRLVHRTDKTSSHAAAPATEPHRPPRAHEQLTSLEHMLAAWLPTTASATPCPAMGLPHASGAALWRQPQHSCCPARSLGSLGRLHGVQGRAGLEPHDLQQNTHTHLNTNPSKQHHAAQNAAAEFVGYGMRAPSKAQYADQCTASPGAPTLMPKVLVTVSHPHFRTPTLLPHTHTYAHTHPWPLPCPSHQRSPGCR